jgi:hypothetical protein
MMMAATRSLRVQRRQSLMKSCMRKLTSKDDASAVTVTTHRCGSIFHAMLKSLVTAWRV